MSERSQHLTIFLAKDKYTEINSIITLSSGVNQYSVKNNGDYVGEIFINKIPAKSPKWASFFDNYLDQTLFGKVSSVSAVLVIKKDERLFALTFGFGRYLLKPDCWEERFGMRVTLNCVDENKIKCIDKITTVQLLI